MCHHRKSLYLCNHAVIAPEPLIVCPAQRDYLSGSAAEPCDLVETHARSTIRLSKLCPQCRGKKTTTDRQLDLVKSRMAELRRHLDESYDNCMKHLDEVGLGPESQPDDDDDDGTATAAGEKRKSRGKEKKKAASPDGDGDEGGREVVDPVQEFLRKKMMEDNSHLMMLSG
ncbi:hypothetical protein F5X99DRAFT_424445 [Biscogniauxia marginata]|nr:hypothetical protein F5X99DRAFT_424445 [Biscogniauxia marginata]